MADKMNGKQHLVERRYTEDEIQQKRKRIVDILDQVDKKKEEIRTLSEEQKEIRADLKRGFEMVEGEELPFHKERRAQ